MRRSRGLCRSNASTGDPSSGSERTDRAIGLGAGELHSTRDELINRQAIDSNVSHRDHLTTADSSQHAANHTAMHIRESNVTAAVAVGQALVVESEQMQHRRP